MLTIENKGNEIYIFGRDKDKNPYVKIDKTFRPYFYYEDEKGKYKGIFGQNLKKKVCNNPADMPKLRKDKKHHEADIIYTNRYLIDRIDSIEKEPIRIWYIDIETSMKEGFPNPYEANNMILSICFYDNFLNEYFTLQGVEKTFITTFINKVIELNPDMLVAWNGDGFDFPYLISRINKIGLDANVLSRMNETFIRDDEKVKYKTTLLKGRILFDLMYGYKKLIQGQGRESWSLEYISQYELKEGKEKYEGTLDELYEKDLEKFLLYNKRDVELLKLLDEKLKIIEFFDNIRRYAICKFEDVFHNSRIVDSLILKFCNGKYILPSKNEWQVEESYEGAFVYQPEKGLYKNIACADLNSLYPSIVIGLNLSPETFLKKKEDNCIDIDGNFFYKKELGIIPEIVGKLIEERKKYKKERDRFNINSIEYKTFENLEQTIKVLTNSIYGVLGFPGFRLYKKEIATTITYMGRRIINHSIDYLNKNGHKVKYGDTDSVFFEVGDKNLEEINKIIGDLNESYNLFTRQFNITNHKFNIDCEKIFKTIFFTHAKKRYVGKLKYYKGKETNNLLVVGFESKRSDSPQIIRDFQKEVFRLILEEKNKSEVEEYVNEFKKNMEKLKEELGIPIGINKDIRKYKNVPIHIRAVNNSNKYHNTNFKYGDKIKYVYVRKCPDNIPFDNVIAFKDKLYDDYGIDYKKMEERLVNNKITTIYDSLGWIKPEEKEMIMKEYKQGSLFEDE
jgi:DNA polymerase I